jgi:hypothetical protein
MPLWQEAGGDTSGQAMPIDDCFARLGEVCTCGSQAYEFPYCLPVMGRIGTGHGEARK